MLELLALTALATHFLVGGCYKPPPPLPPTANSTVQVFDIATDEQVAEEAIEHPEIWFFTDVRDVIPIGHPIISASDCVTNPTSQGCRIANVHALAQAQSETVENLCISDRVDLYVKRTSAGVDVIDGVPFDTDWLIRIPGDVFETALARWPGGLSYWPDLDQPWAEALEDSCCHDGLPGTCTASDQCLFRYGNGYDTTQIFHSGAFGADLRNADYREWSAARLAEKVLDTGGDCVVLGYKPGWWMAPNHAGNTTECRVPGSPAWVGPTKTYDPCASAGGLLSNTPYAVGQYQDAMNQSLRDVFAALDAAGLTDVEVLLVEAPQSGPNKWSWMASDVRSNAHLVGEFYGGYDPFSPPGPSLGVVLKPSPLPITAAPYVADVKGDVEGTATGNVDYHFWCNCTETSADPSVAQTTCGTTPGEYLHVTGAGDPYTANDVCSYAADGDYMLKVIAERQGITAEDRLWLTVGPAPWPLP